MASAVNMMSNSLLSLIFVVGQLAAADGADGVLEQQTFGCAASDNDGRVVLVDDNAVRLETIYGNQDDIVLCGDELFDEFVGNGLVNLVHVARPSFFL